MSDRILIIGGYGKAGLSIAQLLIDYTNTDVTLAGRNLSKASQAAHHIDPQRCHGLALDLSDTKALAEALPNYKVLILCVPFPTDMSSIIQTIVESAIHYIDIVPNSEKNRLFNAHEYHLQKQQTRVILEAGWEPGLPSFLVRWLAMDIKRPPSDITIKGFYRDRSMPYSSCADIFDHAKLSVQTFQKGSWQQTSLLQGEEADFPPPFGTQQLYPTELEELHELTRQWAPEKLSYYHSGYGMLCDTILFVWMLLGLRKFKITRKWGVQLFQWVYRSTSKPPYGGALKASVTGVLETKTATLTNEELYTATAIPVIATVKQLLDYKAIQPGVHFMGIAINPAVFAQDIAEMGLGISTEH